MARTRHSTEPVVLRLARFILCTWLVLGSRLVWAGPVSEVAEEIASYCDIQFGEEYYDVALLVRPYGSIPAWFETDQLVPTLKELRPGQITPKTWETSSLIDVDTHTQSAARKAAFVSGISGLLIVEVRPAGERVDVFIQGVRFTVSQEIDTNQRLISVTEDGVHAEHRTVANIGAIRIEPQKTAADLQAERQEAKQWDALLASQEEANRAFQQEQERLVFERQERERKQRQRANRQRDRKAKRPRRVGSVAAVTGLVAGWSYIDNGKAVEEKLQYSLYQHGPSYGDKWSMQTEANVNYALGYACLVVGGFGVRAVVRSW